MIIMTKKEENFTATDFDICMIQKYTLQHILAGIIYGRRVLPLHDAG
jgi:hypothetical protein